MNELDICSECGGRLIYGCDEVYCSVCGTVFDDHIDYLDIEYCNGLQAREFSSTVIPYRIETRPLSYREYRKILYSRRDTYISKIKQ